jgi:hypothetical protein
MRAVEQRFAHQVENVENNNKEATEALMNQARYHRGLSERCLEIARHLSDPLAASLMRADAARHREQADQVDQVEDDTQNLSSAVTFERQR